MSWRVVCLRLPKGPSSGYVISNLLLGKPVPAPMVAVGPPGHILPFKNDTLSNSKQDTEAKRRPILRIQLHVAQGSVSRTGCGYDAQLC